MMKTLNLLGFDFGASSGRAMLGVFDGTKIDISELHRFSNDPVMINGRFVWDVQRLFFEMKEALTKASKQGIEIDAIGIDTWGVDFGLLDKNGNLAGIPLHYRDHCTDGMMEKAYEIVSKEEIFAQTGLAFMQFNTLYQLLALKLADDPILKIADKMLFMPDLLAYFFTGEMGTEYTIASTSQMINPHTGDWAYDLLKKFDLPTDILTEIQPAGTVRGMLKEDICKECGVKSVPVIAIGGHDTASAVAAVPAKPGSSFAYISSGTWSLFGTELEKPLCSPEVMQANYTNEGGVLGDVRFLKNIMGLWIIQECKREWDRRGEKIGFAEIVELAEKAPAFKAVIDVDDDRFLAPGNMPERIQEYCRETNQPVPEGKGEIARVIYEGLALKYRWAIERMEELTGKKFDVLHIVGGGSNNLMLNRFTASAVARPVITGPSEGTVIGNLLMQAKAMGSIADMNELRQVVANSFETKEYLPAEGEAQAWEAAYQRLLQL